MAWRPGFFDVDERLAELSAKGDDLERLKAIVDFEMFRADLEQAVPRNDRSKGGRPPFDHVFMFRVLILQTSHSLSDERTEYLIKDRLSFMRFLGLRLAETVPDANTIWTFREALTRAKIDGQPAIEVLFQRFDAALTRRAFSRWAARSSTPRLWPRPSSATPRTRRRTSRKAAFPRLESKPAKLRQKDRDARWTVKYSKAKPRADGKKQIDLAIPAFGYKNHIGIDNTHRLIRTWTVTDASRHDGANSAVPSRQDQYGQRGVGRYRLPVEEERNASAKRTSAIHRKKPKGKPMPERMAKANAAKSKVRAAVEHVFAWQKGPMGLFVRTIGLARAKLKIGLANLASNMKRAVWLTTRSATA